MAVHIDNLQAHVASLIANLGKGIKDGQIAGGCVIQINSQETQLTISGEITFSTEVPRQRQTSALQTPKITKQERPVEVERQGQESYQEQSEDGGVVNQSIGMDQSVTRTFQTFTAT